MQVVRDSAGIITEAITSYPAALTPALDPSDTLVVEYDYGTPTPNSVFHYQYDSHPNPVSIGNEALLLPDRSWEFVPPMTGWFSKNNIINGSVTYVLAPGLDVSDQRVFNYTSAGLPLTNTDQWVNLVNIPTSSGATHYYYQ